ncbi:MAG: hypothetical protein JNL57_04960 [Bacteroidetes bacterium]|nr:hypothetical protein [Bacteroidota bacterium]
MPESKGPMGKWLRGGKPVLQSRLFWMTDNYQNGQLKDDYAIAAGASVGYVSPLYHGLGFGLSGWVQTNIASSHLEGADPQTGQLNRYEVGLYDVARPGTRNFLWRPEELFVYGNISLIPGWKFQGGRFMLNTPFLNAQDGRMRGTLVQGFHTTIPLGRGQSLSASHISGISPRSTVKWYSMDQSVGLYPAGRTLKDKPSAYQGNLPLTSLGIYSWSLRSKKLQVEVWDYLWWDVMNTAFAEGRYNAGNWMFGLQMTRQDRLFHGGDILPEKRYFEQTSSMVISGRVAYGWKKHLFHMNATRIGKQGRFLFPREWGREPFYTFLPRERNEGTADVWAFTAGYQNKGTIKGLQFSIAGGYYRMPPVTGSPLLNKYTLNDYLQANVNFVYKIPGISGLEVQLLLVAKKNMEDGTLLARYEYNRVNLFQSNLVVNYQFQKQKNKPKK